MVFGHFLLMRLLKNQHANQTLTFISALVFVQHIYLALEQQGRICKGPKNILGVEREGLPVFVVILHFEGVLG